MGPMDARTPPAAADADATPTPPRWGRRLVVGAVVLLGLAILSLLGASYLPRWWAHRVGAQVDSSTVQGVGVGLFYGSVFTFLALIVLWITFRRRRSWKVRVAGIAAALILAVPNLLTLGIVVGTGSAAHAGERTLDVEAPFFRGATLVGALAAVAAFGALMYLLASRRRDRRAAAERRVGPPAQDENGPASS